LICQKRLTLQQQRVVLQKHREQIATKDCRSSNYKEQCGKMWGDAIAAGNNGAAIGSTDAATWCKGVAARRNKVAIGCKGAVTRSTKAATGYKGAAVRSNKTVTGCKGAAAGSNEAATRCNGRKQAQQH
jgi:hypothetical protein